MPYRFPVVLGNEPALMGMSDCDKLQLLSVNCSRIDVGQRNMHLMNSQNMVSPKQKNLKIVCIMLSRLIKPYIALLQVQEEKVAWHKVLK